MKTTSKARRFWAVYESFNGEGVNVQAVPFKKGVATLKVALTRAMGAEGFEPEGAEIIKTRKSLMFSHFDGHIIVAWTRAEAAEAYLDLQIKANRE